MRRCTLFLAVAVASSACVAPDGNPWAGTG